MKTSVSEKKEEHMTLRLPKSLKEKLKAKASAMNPSVSLTSLVIFFLENGLKEHQGTKAKKKR